MSEWFQAWFDSEYYHKLYSHRDDIEADFFIKRLFEKIQVKRKSKVLDLACGKGRHSLSINKLGYFVTGIDLSESSIDEADRYSSEDLEFFIHDMRLLFRLNFYDVIVNLFTSFGYFDDIAENERVLGNVYHSLKEDGIFILDYLNPKYVKKNLVGEEVIRKQDIEFYIKRRIEDGVVIKNIKFEADGQDYHFQERVRLFKPSEFRKLFDKYDFKIVDVWGSYSLEPYHKGTSARQIYYLKK